MNLEKICVAVIGLGYVGLPLALNFGKKFLTIGYDLKEDLILKYIQGIDPSKEVSPKEFQESKNLTFTSNPSEIFKADFIIISVPTPIDIARQPDLKPIISASETVAKYMKKGSIIIYESTVYPGVTEDVCVPILEKISTYKWKQDFNIGYSPERINPGDKDHTLTKIVKVVSGDSKETLDRVANLYGSIIEAGVFKVQTIKEAEAAKVIENTQRDLNIALMNELAILFDKLDIDTTNVLEAAGTKWNFLPFRPGLVGGHCIGVDPYYLTYKAETIGLHPEVILAGRRINDSMGKFIAEKTVKMMIKSSQNIKGANVGILGLTFKENCPDLRNSKVIDIIDELVSYGINVHIHDPVVDPEESYKNFNIVLSQWQELNDLSALIVAVAHTEFTQRPIEDFLSKLKHNGCLIDVKSIFDHKQINRSNVSFWRL